MTLALNQALPDFSILTTQDKRLTLAQLLGKKTILYFYPKDNTSGCTQEGRDFSAAYPEFLALNTAIFGVSRDSLHSHQQFKAEQQFPFELLVDDQEQLCQLFDVLKPRMMYGKSSIGIERSTFLIDEQGILRQEWRKVKVDNHAQDVLAAVKALS